MAKERNRSGRVGVKATAKRKRGSKSKGKRRGVVAAASGSSRGPG